MNKANLAKAGRNDPCACGSGKKYKHCCLQTKTNQPASQSIDIEDLNRRAQQAASVGNFEQAVLLFRQLLTAMPADAYPLASLGQMLCWQHKRREGLGYLRQAAEILASEAVKSGDSQFVLEISEQLLHWGDIATAEPLAKLAVKLAPESPAALSHLAYCLNRVNRNTEALPFAQKACDLLPDNPACQNLLAIIAANQGQITEARQLLEHIIELDTDKAQTARAYLELANILDKQTDYEPAFKAASKGLALNAELTANLAISVDYLYSSIAINKTGFNTELLQRWPAALLIDDDWPAPAFLLGFLRSGTTLTEQILAAHPKVFVTDESSIVNELAGKLAAISGILNNIPKALASLSLEQIKQLRSFFWQRMQEEYGDSVLQQQLVDKNALNSIELGLISVVFPEAKILFALRDPRDVCISCLMQSFIPSPATINLLSWQGIAKQYAAVMDYWLSLQDKIQPRYLQLRYEDSVLDFENCYRPVFEFLGVDWIPEVSRFHEQARHKFISTPSFAAVSQPIYNTAIGRWQHYQAYLPAILPQLQRFIKAFGYPI